MRRVSQDGSDLAGIAIDEDECGTFDAVAPLPIDREGDIGFFFCPQSQSSDPVGREGRAQGGLCSALVTANGQEGCLRRLLHLQEHGAGADLPCHRAEVSHQGSQPPQVASSSM